VCCTARTETECGESVELKRWPPRRSAEEGGEAERVLAGGEQVTEDVQELKLHIASVYWTSPTT
jgi:hypothetical protein